MSPLQKTGYLAHARSAAFARREIAARECVAEASRLCRRPFVSFSGGKDSAAMLYIALCLQPDADVRICTWWETRYLHPRLDECLQWWHDRFPRARIVEVREGFLPDDAGGVTDEPYGWNNEPTPWGNAVAGFGTLAEVLHKSHGENETPFDGVMIGTRSDESWNRRFSHGAHRDAQTDAAIHRYASGFRAGTYRVCPLSTWSVRDVGAVIAANDIPLLGAYDHGLHTRTTLRMCQASMPNGVVEKLWASDPEAFYALCERSANARREVPVYA